jgi:hypothetical protein
MTSHAWAATERDLADLHAHALGDQPVWAHAGGAIGYLTATTSTVRMSGSFARKSGATCASASGIWPFRWS